MLGCDSASGNNAALQAQGTLELFGRSKATLGALVLVLAACEQEERSEIPPPEELTRDAVGYYCSMIVVDHQGPKGQVFLTDRAGPIWFTSVRDTLAFTMLPEEPKNISAIYVSDMGRASWNVPETGTWIDARTAWYVIGSDKVGGMGAPEPVPFGDKEAAQSFALGHGGEVFAFDNVPSDAVLGAVVAPAE